jgi:hypothetical protein
LPANDLQPAKHAPAQRGSDAMKTAAMILGGLAASALLGSAPNAAERRPPYVLELFTSQGCSSCPPANANLIRLRERPDVLALSFAVTYWDSLGWKDIFGRPEFTRRQETYEPPLGHSGPFTPQMVVNGERDTVGADIGEIQPLLAGAHLAAAPSVDLSGSHVGIGAGAAPQGGADVWLVRYDARVIDVPVTRGENAGHTLPHANVVREFTRLGKWDGAPASFNVAQADGALRTAVLVQLPGGGRILSAATD